MLRAVHLHGRLGQRFGRRHDLAVNSPAEAVRALIFQIPGFEAYIRARKYVVSVGEGTVVDGEALALRLGQQRDIHITPAGMCAGIETILLGVTLALVALSTVAILTMPKAPTAASREEATKTSSFIFTSAENVTEQGHPVALVYGRHRVGSVVGSAGIATTDVNAASLSQDPTNPTFGGSPGGGGEDPGGPTYPGYVGTSPGLQGSRFGSEWDMQLLKGGKGGSGGSRSAQEDPNTLQSQATAKVLDIISEGECVGLADGMKSIYFDETPLQNADGSFNFAGVSIEQRVGLPDQDFIPGFSQTENTIEVGTQVTVALGPVTRTVVDPSATVARVTIRLPQLFQQDTENGDLKSTSVAVKISVQADGGGFTDVTTMTFNGKTNSGYQRSVDVRLPVGDERDIRVTRITADSDLASLSNETHWDLLTEIVEAKLSYPDTALIGLTVDARQFGSSIPTRSYDWIGLIIEVPTNYDPETRAYDGIWDGTFKRAWSDNPAWVLRDIVVNRRYGLGARVPPEALDIWGLYAIAQHCDELVPDFAGGEHPRYTINCSIKNPAQAYDVLASIASNFRGWTYWGSGTIIAVQDRPEDPSVLLTPSNVVDGRFKYGRVTPVEKRRSVFVVYWNDPDDGYRLTPEIVEDPDLIRRFGRRPGDEMTAFGVTNRGQAHRMALWVKEDESPASNSTAAYEVGDDHAFVEPGRIASLADPMFTESRRGGRVRAAAAGSVTIDAPYEFEAGQEYTLRVMLPNGTVSVRAITNVAGEATVVTLGGADWGTPPNPGAVWTIESTAVANRQFRVRQIDTDEPPYGVRAVLHDPTKYERVEQDRDISTPTFMGLPFGPLVPPDALEAFEFLLQEGNASIPCIQVSWSTAAPDPRVSFYQSQYKPPGEEWQPFGEGVEVSRIVRNSRAGDWSFRVRALDSLGRKTAWVEKTFALDGQADALPDVIAPTLVTNPDAFIAKLVWVAPVDHRPLRFDVLFNPDEAVIGDAVYLGTTDQLEWTISAAGFYWVRTRFINVVSAAPDVVEVELADIGFLPGLGDLASLDEVQIGVGGNVAREDGISPVTDANAITALGTAAAIISQGILATRDKVKLGTGGELVREDNTTRVTDALAITSLGTASAIASQGALATLSQVALGATGRVYRDDGTTRLTDALAVTALGTAAAISGQGAFATISTAAYGSGYLTGFGTIAARNNVRLANEVYRADGSTLLTDALAVTSLGTAAAISGQGAFATLSSAAYGSGLLTGFGTLAARSTARLGNEVYQSDGTTILTDALGVTSLGTAASIAGQGTFATLSSISSGLADTNNLLRRTAGGLFSGELAADVTSTHTAASIASQGALATLSQVNLGASGRVYRDDGSTRLTDALAVTSLGTASAIASQGALATLSSVAWGASGRVYRDDGTTRVTDASSITALGTASAIASQGALATLSQVNIGASGRVYRDDGSTRLTDALAVTSLGTAAAISGQGSFATLSSISSGLADTNNLLRRTAGGLFSGELAADVTSTHTAASITSQGALATLGQVNLGASGRVYRDDGTTRLTDSLAVTSLGTAAAIIGQAAIATDSDAVGRILSMRGDNYVRNGDFREGMSQYTLGPGAHYTSISWTAPYAIYFDNGASGTTYAYLNQNVAVSFAFRRAFFSIDVYSTISTNMQIVLVCSDSGGTFLGYAIFLFTAGTSGWATYEGSAACPASTAKVTGYVERLTAAAELTHVTNIRVGATQRASTLGARAGTDIFRTDGLTVMTQAEVRTAEGTAASIVSQGTGATASNLTALNATEGAKLTLVSPRATSGRNLIPNSNAETASTEHWFADSAYPATLSTTTTNARSGKYAFLITKGGTGETVQQPGRAISVTPLKKYVFRVPLMGAASSASGLYIGLNKSATLPASGCVMAADASARDDIVSNAACPAAYTVYEMVWTCPAGTYWVSPAIIPWAGCPSVYYDDIEFFELPDLETAGSGHQMGDQRNLVPLTAAGIRYRFTGTVSYSATAGTPATATISVTAGSLLIGGVSVALNAMSVGVSGTGGTTVNYQLYINNPTWAAGAQTLVATTTVNDLVGADGRIWIGYCDVLYPTSGGGSGGGGSGGGGQQCVWTEAWVETQEGWIKARDIRPGDVLRVLAAGDGGTTWEPCTGNETGRGTGWRIITESGMVVSLSDATPITLRDGRTISVEEIDGHELPVFDGNFRWEKCRAERAGPMMVAHIRCSDQTYAAGDVAGRSILTHNPKP